LKEIAPILRDRRDVLANQIETREAFLRDDFANLEILDYRRSFDECLTIIRSLLKNA
jgi:hypothetical protein